MYLFYNIVCFAVLTTLSYAYVSDKVSSDDPHYLVIKEDVIPDVENTTQKVIRVNPLDLPSMRDDKEKKEDSSLYKIQSFHPPTRRYVNSKRMRKTRPRPYPTEKPDVHMALPRSSLVEPKFQKPKKNKQHLKFLYDQPTLDGQTISKNMRVKFAPGAYPVYYTVAKVNGKFGKFPIKSFRTPTEFMKYLVRTKSYDTTSSINKTF